MPRTEEQKARRKELDFINRDKIREQIKAYNLKHKNKIKEQHKAYHLKHRDKILEQNKAYHLKHRDKLIIQRKARYLENRDKEAVRNKEYNLKNHKQNMIRKWKSRGLISDDYDALYDYYISVKNCEICCVELTAKKNCKTRRAMDHSHSTGEFRNVLCNCCNINLKE